MNTTSPITAPPAYSPAVTATETIAQLNDDMRTNPKGPGKRAVVTRRVNHLGADFTKRAMAIVAAYDNFRSGVNTNFERDYGLFELDGHEMLFKIDYLDTDGVLKSEDPTDPAQTLRVLTIMFASEY